MENISEQISLFHNLHLACLAGMIFFLLISVILFIRLNIWNVIGFYTGWQARHEIRKLKDNSSKKAKGESGIRPELRKNLGLRKSGELEIRKVKDFAEVKITKRLSDGSGEVTELLRLEEDADEGTTLLSQKNFSFFIEREILLIHTDEIIA